MTVCVAAIAEKTTVIGASDRMITAGDIEFEPGQAKMWNFTRSIWALVAGDMAIQASLMREVHKEAQDWIVAKPETWLKVKDVAQLYCKKYRELLREQAEAAILHPLGLDLQSFLAKQSTMHADVVASIAQKLSEFDFPSALEAIFLGIDTDGPVKFPKGETLVYPQIYVTEGDKLSWLTAVGFAAIGIGKSHAESQFMFSGHWPLKPFDETILLTFAAKKRAEVAPGVGKDTDMVVIGPGLGTALKVEDKHVKELGRIYDRSRNATDKGVKKAQAETKIFVEQVKKEYKDKADAEKQTAGPLQDQSPKSQNDESPS